MSPMAAFIFDSESFFFIHVADIISIALAVILDSAIATDMIVSERWRLPDSMMRCR